MSDWSVIETYLARSVLRLADKAGVPDSYWQTDQDISLAREIAGIPDDGRETHAWLWEDEGMYE